MTRHGLRKKPRFSMNRGSVIFRQQGAAFQAAAKFVFHIGTEDVEGRFGFRGVDPGGGTDGKRVPHPADLFRGQGNLRPGTAAVSSAQAAFFRVEKEGGLLHPLSAEDAVVEPRLEPLAGGKVKQEA